MEADATDPLDASEEDRREMEQLLNAVFYEDPLSSEERLPGESGAPREYSYIPQMQPDSATRRSMLFDGPLPMLQGNHIELMAEQMMREMGPMYGSSNDTQPSSIHRPQFQQLDAHTLSNSMSGAATSSRTQVESGSVLEVNVGGNSMSESPGQRRRTLHGSSGLDTLASIATLPETATGATGYENVFGVDATSGGIAPPPKRRKARQTTQTTAPPPEEDKQLAPPATQGVGRGKINAAVAEELYRRLYECTNCDECRNVIILVADSAAVSKQALEKMLTMKSHTLISNTHWSENMWKLYGRDVFCCAVCDVYTPRVVCSCQKKGRSDHISLYKRSLYPTIRQIYDMLINTTPAATDANGGN